MVHQGRAWRSLLRVAPWAGAQLIRSKPEPPALPVASGARRRAVERVLEINGAEVHYWDYHEGTTTEGGPTVVMVHGLRGTHHGLEPIVEHLPGRRVVVPDLPGFGDSGPMDAYRHDVEGYAELITALVRRIGGPVVLVGHSFGSLVAAKTAAGAPELVRRLVLINPIASRALEGPSVWLSGLTARYYSLGKALPERAGHALLSNKLVVLAASRAMTRSKDRQLRRFVDGNHLRHFSRFHSAALVSETFEASVSHTVADYADGLELPTLLIAGESDDIAPLPGQRILAARLHSAELVVIPGVGHLVHYETPAMAAASIERFLES